MIKQIALKIAQKINPDLLLYKNRSDEIEKINKYPVSHRLFTYAMFLANKGESWVGSFAKKNNSETNKINTKDSSICENQKVYDHFCNRYVYSLPMLAKIAEDPLVDKIVRMPASDALAAGYKINWADNVDEYAKESIESCLAKYRSDDVIRSAIENERVYGAGFILPIFNSLDDDGVRDKSKELAYYKTSYKKNGVNCARNFFGFRVVGTEDLSALDIEYSDVLSTKYHKPEIISYNGFYIHQSHFIKLKSRKKYGRISGDDFFIGQSIVAQVVREVYNWEQSSEVSIDLLKTKRDKVLSVSRENMESMSCFAGIDATEGFAVQGSTSYVEQLQSMSNDTTMVIQNGDSLNVLQTTLSDVPNLNEYLMRNIAVVTQIPITKLFGASPAGLSSTGESDTKNYSQYLKSIQKDLIEPSLKSMIKIIADMYSIDCYECDIEFNPIDAPTQSEVTDNLAKQSNAMKTLIDAGVITETEAREYLNTTQGNGIVGLNIIQDYPLGETDMEDGEEDAIISEM